MRIGVEDKSNEIDIVLNSLKSGEKNLFNLLIDLMKNGLTSSDILFMILEELEKNGIVKGKRGKIFVLKEIDDNLKAKLNDKITRKIKKIRKIFVTPLEISKFYLCPRRLWLEKVALSKQEKEERGDVWDGEAIHYAVRLLIQNLKDLEIEMIVKDVLETYENKITINKELLIDFLERFLNFVKEENFEEMFAEKTIESLRIGLVGTPDIIAIKNENAFPIDIKLGKSGRLKKEHILQSVGEALLVQEFFRKEVEKIYLVYFGSKSVVEFGFRPNLKKVFMKYKKGIERMLISSSIPKISNLPNFKKRVCAGCHVKRACDLIESYKKVRM